MKKPRIIVEVTDGMVYVYSDKPDAIDLIVVDYDTGGMETADLCEINGQAVAVSLSPVGMFNDGSEAYWQEAHEKKSYKPEEAPGPA